MDNRAALLGPIGAIGGYGVGLGPGATVMAPSVSELHAALVCMCAVLQGYGCRVHRARDLLHVQMARIQDSVSTTHRAYERYARC